MCQNKRAFIYLLGLFALVLAHFPNCTVFPSRAFKEKLQILVFGYKLEPPREKKKKRALGSQLLRICDILAFQSPHILPKSMFNMFMGFLLLQ